jgi:hypothetical protein
LGGNERRQESGVRIQEARSISNIQQGMSREEVGLLRVRDLFDLEIGHWKSLVGYLKIRALLR